MALGNAWHLPGGPLPFGRASMRDPAFPADPAAAVTVYSGSQYQGAGNPGNQQQDGSAVRFRRPGETAWASVPLAFAGAAGDDKYYAAVLPAFPAGTGVQYYLVIAYDDHDTTFLRADASGLLSVAAGEEAAAQAAPFGYTVGGVGDDARPAPEPAAAAPAAAVLSPGARLLLSARGGGAAGEGLAGPG